MRFVVVILFLLALPHITCCQEAKTAKIHIYCSGFNLTLYSVLSPNIPIKFSGKGSYAVLEVAMDTLKLRFGRKHDHVVAIPLAPGKSYFYRISAGGANPILFNELSEQGFLLMVAFLADDYQRYSLTRESGVRRIEN